jgi:hypothetical protein
MSSELFKEAILTPSITPALPALSFYEENMLSQSVFLFGDYNGCKHLQQLVENGSPDFNFRMVVNLFPHFTEIMRDQFGNYLC